MTTYPALSAGSTLWGTPQTVHVSIHGRRFGLGATGTVINSPGGAGSTAGEIPPYPLKPEAGNVITATTADVLSNYIASKLSSTAVSAVFTIADPVPGCVVRLVLAANPTTAFKLVTVSSNVTFSSTAQSFAITQNSSLFYDQASLELVGMSTGAYRVGSWFNNNGTTLLALTFATG